MLKNIPIRGGSLIPINKRIRKKTVGKMTDQKEYPK
jgi:hypothetical protein